MKIAQNYDVKCEGRDIIREIIADWEEIYNKIYDRLESYWDTIGEPSRTTEVMVTIAPASSTLRECECVDEEDAHIAAGEYLYHLYCMLQLVKHLTAPHWCIVAAELKAHFWRVLAIYGCKERKPIVVRLEGTGMSRLQFLTSLGISI